MTVKKRFSTIIEQTLCPFARAALIVYGPVWERNLTEAENVRRNALALEDFCRSAPSEKFHGVVLEIGINTEKADFDEIKLTFRRILTTLNSLDPKLSRCLDDLSEEPGWQFEFAGLRLFCNVFAPCYRPQHSKYSYTTGEMFIFMQPEISFDYCGINRNNRSTKQAIRDAFAEAGRPYDGSLVETRVEAWLYIFPLEVGDSPVKW